MRALYARRIKKNPMIRSPRYPATKNYDMGFRDYSPGLNRFLTLDMYNGALADMGLATDPWTGNRYAFTGGNPISGIERDGHDFDWGDTGGFFLGVGKGIGDTLSGIWGCVSDLGGCVKNTADFASYAVEDPVGAGKALWTRLQIPLWMIGRMTEKEKQLVGMHGNVKEPKIQ